MAFYSFEDVYAEHCAANGLDFDQKQVKAQKRYFAYFLCQTGIPQEYLQKPGRNFTAPKQWCFNDDGKELLLNFMKDRNDDIYKTMRRRTPPVPVYVDFFLNDYLDVLILIGKNYYELYKEEYTSQWRDVDDAIREVYVKFWYNKLSRSKFDIGILPGFLLLDIWFLALGAYRLDNCLEPIDYVKMDCGIIEDFLDRTVDEFSPEWHLEYMQIALKWSIILKAEHQLFIQEGEKLPLMLPDELQEKRQYYLRAERNKAVLNCVYVMLDEEDLPSMRIISMKSYLLGEGDKQGCFIIEKFTENGLPVFKKLDQKI